MKNHTALPGVLFDCSQDKGSSITSDNWNSHNSNTFLEVCLIPVPQDTPLHGAAVRAGDTQRLICCQELIAKEKSLLKSNMSLGKFLFSLAVCWFGSKFNHSGQGISWPLSSLALSHHSDTWDRWDFLVNPAHEKPIPPLCSLLTSKGSEVVLYLFI